jgi:hypothetical protein
MIVTRTFSDEQTDDRTMATGASVTWMHCSNLFEVTWVKQGASVQTRPCVRADAPAFTRTQPSVHMDMGVRTDASPSPLPSLPPPLSPLPSPLSIPRLPPSPLLSAWTQKIKIKNNFYFFW